MVKALDSHARGCGFKSCLAQDKDYWWGKVTGAHLHKSAHSPGHCPLWLGNRLRLKSSIPHKKLSYITYHFFLIIIFCRFMYKIFLLTSTFCKLSVLNIRCFRNSPFYFFLFCTSPFYYSLFLVDVILILYMKDQL